MNETKTIKTVGFPLGNKIFILYNHQVVKGEVTSILLGKALTGETIPVRYEVDFHIDERGLLNRSYAAKHIFANKKALKASL